MIRKVLIAGGILIAALVVAAAAVVAVFWDDVSVRAQNMYDLLTNEPEYAEGFADRGEFLDYLGERPDDFSLVVKTGGETEFSHLPDEPSPLASTKKIIVLAVYAEEVSEGRLDPEEEIPVSEWERFYVPATDGGAHPAAMERLDLETDDLGYATDSGATVRLDEMAGAMISVSDNAATDYLVQRLGQEKIDAFIERESLSGQGKILPLSGSQLVWNGPEGEGTPGLGEMSDEEYASHVLEATEEYADGGYPDEWREGRPPIGTLARQGELTANYETIGTASDYTRIMDEVASREFVSEEVSGIMSRHLGWPMERPQNEERYGELGAKGGSLAGIFTEAIYAVPKEGDFAGEERVVVVFVRDMSSSAWLGVQQSDGYSDFVDSLLTDREFSQRVERETGQGR